MCIGDPERAAWKWKLYTKTSKIYTRTPINSAVKKNRRNRSITFYLNTF